MELIKDTKDRELGKREHCCRICGAKGLFSSYMVREMMTGSKDEFEYFVCSQCVCLQISEIPEDLEKYYGKNYYSMSPITGGDDFGTEAASHFEKILDVGCGAGRWLYEKAKEGYYNLYGCDPFISEDIRYSDRVQIKKCDILDVQGEGTFDLVRMRDSYEHVTNPQEVLEKASKLIKPDGVIFLEIPTYPNIAFDMFGSHWYQLDAPRHIYIHSLISLRYLAELFGLRIVSAVYNSNNAQIIRSFFYQNGIPYNEITNELIAQFFSPEDIAKAQEISEQANKANRGDHMIVYMAKKS